MDKNLLNSSLIERREFVVGSGLAGLALLLATLPSCSKGQVAATLALAVACASMKSAWRAISLRLALTLLLASAGLLRAAESPQSAPSVEPGLVGYWNFDEGDGTAVKDSSKCGHDGAVSGAKWVKGAVGNALKFNGVTDFANMRCPGSGVIDKAVSVEAWIQSAGNNVNANLVFAGPESLDFGIWIQGGRFFAGIWNSDGAQCSVVSPGSPTPGQWYHVAMTCDFNADKTVKLYIDGKLSCSSAAVGTAIRSAHTSIDIGGRTPNSSYFNGIIDDVKIYNRALSEEEIRKPYEDYLKRKAEGIDVAAYKNSPWIWTEKAEQGAAYFRKSFTVPDLTGKKVFMVCDGRSYQVFLNGKAIMSAQDYSEAQMVDITGELKAGENVIAAQATKNANHPGFFAYVGFPRKESAGGNEMLMSSEGMKCSSESSKGWYLREFDDSKWTQSRKVSDFNKSLAIERNFPDLGQISNNVHHLSPPEFEGGNTMQTSNDGLTLILQLGGKKHSFRVEDSVTHENWFMPGPPFLIDDQVSAWDGSVSCEKIDNGFKVTSSGFDKFPGLKISYTLVLRNRSLEVTLDPIQFPADKKYLSLTFPLDFGAARSGEEGYLVSSIGNYDAREGRMFPFGMDVEGYKKPDGFEIRGEATLPFFGTVRRGHPCVAIITDFPAIDFELKTLVRQNSNGVSRLCSTTPVWSFEKDRVNEPRHINYQFLKTGGYVEMAKTYRQFLMSKGRYVTLRDRVKQRPASNLSVNASFFWGAYPLSDMPAFMAKLKENGMNKAVLQVANKNDFVGGWKRWPEGMTSASGTTEEFRKVANVARTMGYGFSPVDEYTPFADRGQDYDAGLRAMRRDGSFYSFEKEKTFFLCDSQKLRFAQRDLPLVKEVIGECPYLLDCEGCSIYDCFDPHHPMTSRQQVLARREFLTYIRDTMGSVVSEGSPIDWLTDIIDVGHGHSLGFEFWKSKPGVFIPLWTLVYGGSVIDLSNNTGANDIMLYAALYGLNARFNSYEIGKTELDWHKRISDAWPERNFYELASHEFLTPLVQKSQFKENGKVVDVIANFSDVEYWFGEQVIPPHDFQVFVSGKAIKY